MLRDPGRFDNKQGPPTGMYPLLLSEPRQFEEYELQRLSAATDFYRSMIGVAHEAHGALQIWGMVHSGSRWVQNCIRRRSHCAKTAPLADNLRDRSRSINRLQRSLDCRDFESRPDHLPAREVFDSDWLPAVLLQFVPGFGNCTWDEEKLPKSPGPI